MTRSRTIPPIRRNPHNRRSIRPQNKCRSGASAQPNTHYTFNIIGDLQLGDQLPAFNLASGASLTIKGGLTDKEVEEALKKLP